MNDPDDDFDRLLCAVRRAEEPTEADRAAVAAALSGALVTAVTAPGMATAAKAGVVLAKSSTVLNVTVGLVVGAVLGAGVSATAFVVSQSEQRQASAPAGAVHAVRNTAHRPKPETIASPMALSSVAEFPPVVAQTNPSFGTLRPQPNQRHALAATAASDAPVPNPPPSGIDPLELETRGVSDVQRALSDGHPVRALSLLDAQDRTHRAGALAEERAALRVFVLCALGRLNEAVPAAADFLNRFPQSPLRERVRSSCASANDDSGH